MLFESTADAIKNNNIISGFEDLQQDINNDRIVEITGKKIDSVKVNLAKKLWNVNNNVEFAFLFWLTDFLSNYSFVQEDKALMIADKFKIEIIRSGRETEKAISDNIKNKENKKIKDIPGIQCYILTIVDRQFVTISGHIGLYKFIDGSFDKINTLNEFPIEVTTYNINAILHKYISKWYSKLQKEKELEF